MKNHNDNINSLLDTLTNVISILIIVFAITQIIVNDATNRINQSGYTAEEINQAVLQKKAAELRELKKKYKIALQDSIQNLESSIASQNLTAESNPLPSNKQQVIPADLTVMKKKLTQLEANYSSSKYARLSPAEIDSKIEELKATIGQYEKFVTAIQQKGKIPGDVLLQINKSDNPYLGEANFVRLPDPRPAPESAKPIFWVCRYGKIIEVPFDRLSKIFLDELPKSFNYSENSYRRITNLINYFDHNRVGTDQFYWDVVPVLKDNDLSKILLSLKWSEDAGETPEIVASNNSFFKHRIQALKDSGENFYFHFQVWEDSFDVYLLAREIVSQDGISAGWTIYEKNEMFMVQQLWPTNQTETDSSQEIKLAID